MNPTDNVYIPALDQKPVPIDIEYVRKNGILRAISEDGKTGTVEVKHGLVISYCAVTLNEEGSIRDFVPRAINKYSKISPVKEEVSEND